MSASLAPMLPQDDFATDSIGSANSGLWTVATGAAEYIPNAGTIPAQPGTELSPSLPSVAGGALNLTMQTYDPPPPATAPGNAYFGSDVVSTIDIAPSVGVGIGFTVVAKLDTTVPGMALGMFLYGPTNPDDPTDPDTHNEIDFEARTDQANGQSSKIQTNVYDNELDNSPGSPTLVSVQQSLTNYGTYTIEWFTNEVLWFVDGQLVCTDTTAVPQGKMTFDLDFWGYNGTFASLPPASSKSADQTYTAEVQSASAFEISCFVAGSRIATPAGEVAVEALAVGDLVLTASGAARPIVWIGHRRVECGRHPQPADVWPVRVRAGALGANVPRLDVLLSPDHSVLIEGELIPVRLLLNDATIKRERVEAVTYFHVELPAHDIILVDGLPCESYLDTGNRGTFDNAAGPIRLHTDFAQDVWQAKACAEQILGGPQMILARRRLHVQAVLMGYATTTNPNLCIQADGRTLFAEIDGERWRVSIPKGTGRVRLASRRCVPAHLDRDENDTRSLGIAIARMWLDGREVCLDSPALHSGWHATEPGCRWTDGDAEIAVAGSRELIFEVAKAGTYWQYEPCGQVRSA